MNKFVRIGVRVGVSVLLLAYLAFRTDWQKVGEAFAHLQWGYWLSALALLTVAQLVSARRWQLLAGALGISVGLRRITSYFFIGMFFNLFLPTSVGGDVVRAYYLTGRPGHKLPAFVSVLSDRINGFYVLLGLACITVAVQFQQLPLWIVLAVWGMTVCFCGGMAMLPWLASWGQHGHARAERVRAMFHLLRQPWLLTQTTLYSLIIQVASIIIVFLVGLGLGLQDQIPFSYYWVLVPLVSVLTLLPSINGMGVRETSMCLLLQPLGVSKETAMTLAFLWFAVFVSVGLLGGLAYLSTRRPILATGHSPLATHSKDGADHGSVDHHSDQGRTRQLDQAA